MYRRAAEIGRGRVFLQVGRLQRQLLHNPLNLDVLGIDSFRQQTYQPERLALFGREGGRFVEVRIAQEYRAA